MPWSVETDNGAECGEDIVGIAKEKLTNIGM